MKLHTLPTLAAALCVLFSPALFAQEMKRYKTASAIVQYTLSGAQSGTETLWFDRYGMREAKLTQTQLSVAGQTVKTNQLTIFESGTTTNVDLDRKTATKMPTPLWAEIVANAKKQGGDLSDLGMMTIKRSGAVKTGDEPVAGKPCEIWEIKSLGSKMWVWNGVVLRQETKLAGMAMKTEATSVQENAAIPGDKFAVPAGITPVESANPLDALRKAREKMKK